MQLASKVSSTVPSARCPERAKYVVPSASCMVPGNWYPAPIVVPGSKHLVPGGFETAVGKDYGVPLIFSLDYATVMWFLTLHIIVVERI